MSSQRMHSHSGYLALPKEIEWRVIVGLNRYQNQPHVKGSFDTTITTVNNQGKKWGDSHLLGVGYHLDVYGPPRQVFPVSGGMSATVILPSPYSKLLQKGASPGVTGVVSEVLLAVFLQTVLGIPSTKMTHIKKGTSKSPDYCVEITGRHLSVLFQSRYDADPSDPSLRVANQQIVKRLRGLAWNNPFPIECKGSRIFKPNNPNRPKHDLSKGIKQLATYWHHVHELAGFGVLARIDLLPTTCITLYLLLPKTGTLPRIQRQMSQLPMNATITDVKQRMGGDLFG